VIRPQSAFAYEGQSAKFYCRVIAIATPTLSWYHNNSELRQSVKFMKRYAGEDFTFIINRVKLDDRGEYVIRAENHFGYREEVVFLNVQRKQYCDFTHELYNSLACYIYIFVKLYIHKINTCLCKQLLQEQYHNINLKLHLYAAGKLLVTHCGRKRRSVHHASPSCCGLVLCRFTRLVNCSVVSVANQLQRYQFKQFNFIFDIYTHF
jgi:hypothetical protein